MIAYNQYSEAVEAFNDIVSVGLKTGNLATIMTYQKPLNKATTSPQAWLNHMKDLDKKLTQMEECCNG